MKNKPIKDSGGTDGVIKITCEMMLEQAIAENKEQAKYIEKLRDHLAMVYGNIKDCDCCSAVAECMVDWEDWLADDEY